jgi:hypothetical protein
LSICAFSGRSPAPKRLEVKPLHLRPDRQAARSEQIPACLRPSSSRLRGFVASLRAHYAGYFSLTIVDRVRTTPQQVVTVFQGTLKSDGTAGETSKLMPTFIDAMFDGFPGVSGKTVMVRSPLKSL